MDARETHMCGVPFDAVHGHDLADEALFVGCWVILCAVDEEDLVGRRGKG